MIKKVIFEMADDQNIRKTKELAVFQDMQPELTIKINPNDGLDLGIIEINRSVTILAYEKTADNKTIQSTMENGMIVIENECKSGTVKLSPKLWKKIGKINKALLAVKDNNCFIIPK
jgi:hypothetical protein